MTKAVTPATIEPTLLPRIELPNSGLWRDAAAPRASCVYFVIGSNGRILYIGETNDLVQRFELPQSHHRMDEAKTIDRDVRIYFLEWPLPIEPLIEVARGILARKEFEAECIIRFDPVLNHQRGKCWGGKTGITGLEYARTTPNGNREIPPRSEDGREGRIETLARRLSDIQRQKQERLRERAEPFDYDVWRAKKQKRLDRASANRVARYEGYARRAKRLAEIGKPAWHALIVIPDR